MYIWIGCKLPDDFERHVRTLCLKLNEECQLDTTAFLLPQHISLKISFETEEYEAILEALTTFLSVQRPFTVRIDNTEQNGNILWMPAEENATLQQLHEQLDNLLEECFCIPQHPFDKEFLFHSTLFIDENTEKVAKMRELLSQEVMAQELTVDIFLLGISETGKAGDYRIARQIKV